MNRIPNHAIDTPGIVSNQMYAAPPMMSTIPAMLVSRAAVQRLIGTRDEGRGFPAVQTSSPVAGSVIHPCRPGGVNFANTAERGFHYLATSRLERAIRQCGRLSRSVNELIVSRWVQPALHTSELTQNGAISRPRGGCLRI